MVVKVEKYCNSQVIEWLWASNNELIPSPFFTSCYLIDGLLIDSGAPAGANDLSDFISALNKDEMVKKCVITHTHEDHAGGANMLQKKFNIPIYASEKALPILKKGYSYPEYRKITWGECLKPIEAKSIKSPVTTSSEEYIFEVFPMPGHAPELIALVEKNQEWAFVSDAVQPKYKMLFGNKSSIQEDLNLIYDSIANLFNFTENMENLKIFVSGQGLFNGRNYLIEKLNEIEILHKKAHKIYQNELQEGVNKEKALKRVLKKLFKRESVIGKLTGGDLSIMNLIKELIKWPLKE
ncbi:MAG: MBL fold metallo-hydrolase [Candidatus Lokiarchaeota archaeon]